MVRRILTAKQSLNKAYQKVTVFRDEFNLFRKNLTQLLSNIDHEESEENVKNHLKDFLNDTCYKDKHLLNTKNKTDLVIYLDKKQDSKAGVLIEVKRPANKGEMITKEDLNRKALQELILYYLQERIESKNDEIKYLIATNIYEWFIFDAVLFENLFYKNAQLVKDYNNWKNDRKVSSRTDHFYNEITKPFLDNFSSDITYTHFDLNEYKKLLNKSDKESERKFIPLYKILSPVHLLKQPFANDSNSLDRNFYNELLHIIGLEEVKVKNKKLINRKSIEERDPGSFIENTIQILKTDQAIDRIKEPVKYGDQIDDQLYHIALELSLTWINRVLFLKLLESQLFNYHRSNEYKFLNSKKINDYDELYKLFHQVLAVKLLEREGAVKDKYALVPYLNSSLFEISDLENQAIRISQLDNSAAIKIYKATVLKDKSGKKRTGTLTALQYLFEFLDAYNFTSEGKEEIEEEKKTLINASVLGLIFEKINGYKDGSYFTPGFITMYMCRETIRRAVVQKFNEKNDWKCETFEDLKNHLVDRRNTKDILEANEVINSLKICDPAVGSGHFLVSALNEIITIKSELGILADEAGLLLSGYDVRIENDELIVTYNHGEELFEYHPPQKRATIIQQVQETLFREKQTLIENCLFGVDINPNSVSIARLRLWIELLKNAYYTKESNYTELETLPNIDINIKEGNSLVSRFKLSEDIFTSADKTAFEIYKMNVNLYKNEHNREKRKQLKTAIDKTRERIKGIALNPVKELDDKISALTEKLHDLNKTDLFEEQKSKAEAEKIEKKRSDLTTKLEKLIAERNSKLEEFKTLYSNAFEWRFEFPEVLDEEGNFVGFDVVIGNPPYYSLDLINLLLKNYLSVTQKSIFNKQANIYFFFIKKGLELICSDGILSLINERYYFYSKNATKLRVFLQNQSNIIELVDFRNIQIFEGVNTLTAINSFKGFKINNNVSVIQYENNLRNITHKEFYSENSRNQYYILQDKLYSSGWDIVDDLKSKLKEKLHRGSEPLGAYVKMGQGIKAGLNDVFIIEDRFAKENKLEISLLRQYVKTKDIQQYNIKIRPIKLLLTLNDTPIDDYPMIKKYLFQYKDQLTQRYQYKDKACKWYALSIPQNISLFETPKEKIITPLYSKSNKFALIEEQQNYYALTDTYIMISNGHKHSMNILLGILNSRLMNFYIRNFGKLKRDDYYEYSRNTLERIPIKIPGQKVEARLKNLIDNIISIKNQNPNGNTSEFEKEIDEIVYKLYGLTEEEIKIIEGNK